MKEPSRYPPVSAFRLFLKMGGWFVIGLTIAILPLTFGSQGLYQVADQFETEGRNAPAEVLERFTVQTRDSDGKKKTSYRFVIEFETEAAETIKLEKSVGSSLYRRTFVGDEIEIRYLASKPHTIEVNFGSHRQGAIGLHIIFLVIGIVWLVLFWVVGRWVVEALRARRYGECVTAKVSDVYQTSIKVNNRSRYRLKWRDDQGRSGQSLIRKEAEVDAYEQGDEIRVYQGLKRSWWAGDIGDPPR